MHYSVRIYRTKFRDGVLAKSGIIVQAHTLQNGGREGRPELAQWYCRSRKDPYISSYPRIKGGSTVEVAFMSTVPAAIH